MITFEKLLRRAKTEKIAIHTPNEEQAIALLEALDKRGYKWFFGDKLTEATYYERRKNICYDFEMVKYLYVDTVSYESLDWYQRHDYTIIEFTDIDFKENA